MPMKKDKPRGYFQYLHHQNKAMIQQYNEESEMNIDLKSVENLSEKKALNSEEETFMGKIILSAFLKERKKSKLVERPTKVTMKPETHK